MDDVGECVRVFQLICLGFKSPNRTIQLGNLNSDISNMISLSLLRRPTSDNEQRADKMDSLTFTMTPSPLQQSPRPILKNLKPATDYSTSFSFVCTHDFMMLTKFDDDLFCYIIQIIFRW